MSTTTLSGPGSNGNEGVLYTLQNSKTRALSPDEVKFHIQNTHFFGGGGDLTPLQQMQSAYSKPHWQGRLICLPVYFYISHSHFVSSCSNLFNG